jgi:mono/diheme cytochrome c family protein
VTSSSPAGCTGGTPVSTQSCTYLDGAALYTQYCSGCHGTSKKGSSATNIQNAIDSNRGGMGSLSFLTAAQVAAIAAAP